MYSFYVYGYLDENFIPFYIGKGKNNRILAHLRLNSPNKYLVHKIKKIQKETNKNPNLIFYAKDLNEDESFLLEKKLIKLYGRKDLGLGSLVNLTNGGDGSSGYIRDTNWKEKQSLAHKGYIKEKNGFYNKHHNITTKTILSKKLKGRIPWNKGKKCPQLGGENNPKAKNYLIKEIDTQKIYIIKCLKIFCKNYNLPYDHIRYCIYTNQPYKKYQITEI